MADLYKIDLNADGTAPVTPQDGYPNGSLSGSEVGANENDDQRVRDLITQEIYEIKQVINNTVVSGSDGMVYEGGLHRTGYQIVTQLENPHDNSGEAGVGDFCLDYLTTDPKWIHVSAEILLSWNSIAATFPTTGVVALQLYTDGAMVLEILHEFSIISTNSETLTFTMTGDVFLGHGTALENPAVTVENQALYVAIGNHSIGVDAAWNVSDIQDGTFDFQVKNVHIDVMRLENAVASNNCPD